MCALVCILFFISWAFLKRYLEFSEKDGFINHGPKSLEAYHRIGTVYLPRLITAQHYKLLAPFIIFQALKT